MGGTLGAKPVPKPRKGQGKRRPPSRPAKTKKNKSPQEDEVAQVCPVVGMGASAGGLEAFQKFFDAMPPDSGLAFVLVQHLDPRHDTLMPELLSKHTRMPVRQVRDETPVERDRVYVIPANATLTIEGGILRVRTPADNENRRTPIDTLFRSLAEDQGGNAVCILFSGSGTDGTLGLRAVKEHGGMTMAQSPESAHHDSIVRSAIATGMVDHVLLPEAMPGKLVEYAAYLRNLQRRRPQVLLEEADNYLVRICELLRRKTGHDFSRYKKATLVRRIQRRMQVLQALSVSGYVERLRSDPGELDLLFSDLLIGVTHFFRDPESFEALEREIVPRLVARAGSEDSLRIWTPGCATGEEAYSVAMLLREAMARAQTVAKVQIFAGDIDDEALEFARQARYPEGIAEQVTPQRLERFFTRRGHTYHVNQEIRELCLFSRHNVIRDPPFSRLDLIVCRNLLIYLENDLQRYLASLFHYALKPGGYLFLGPSESFAGPPDLFRVVDKKHRIFERNEMLRAAPPRIPQQLPAGPAPAKAAPGSAPPHRAGGRAELVQSLERLLLESYAPAWVIVNTQSEVVYFSPRTGRFLEPPAGSPNVDVVGMARQGLRLDLRTALHKAVKSGQTVVHKGVTVMANGDVHRINLVVRPVTELGNEPGLFMIVFQELGPPRSREQAEAEGDVPQAGDPHAQQLESELKSTKEHLQATIEELETSNEELKSANEELQSSNEELQSTNEELQTSKEELQSVNEELETINLELGKKVEELDRAHSDLHNLLQSTQIPTLFLDNEARIKKFTQAATDVFRLIETDVGRPLADIAPRFADGNLVVDAKEVIRTMAVKERRVWLADGSASYVMRILPYRRMDGVVDGVVITFLDVTRLDRALEQQARLATIIESSRDAIVGRDFEGTITSWNQGATDLLGFSEAEAVGKSVSIIVPRDMLGQVDTTHERVKNGDAIPPFETARLTKDGRRIPVSATIAPIRETNGRIVGAAAVFRDITELKQTQEALAQELRRKDEFLAQLSHELRNPLAPVRNCLDVLKQGAVSGAQGRKSLEMMDRQLGHLTALVDQLMDLSRIAGGRLVIRRDVVDLVELVRSGAEDHLGTLEDAGLKLSLRLPDGAVWVKGDVVRLSQVLANLLSNAVKFTDRGGTVTVSVKSDLSNNAASVSVRDTGIGMKPEFLDQLFGPVGRHGFTGHRGREGLGLGLSLVKGLVEVHGGAVKASSDGPGRGSELTVLLPLAPAGARPRRRPVRTAPARPVKASAQRILIVEDNEDAAESGRIMLELAGHKVDVAHDGATALRKARSLRPGVVVCDIALPGGMDGHAIARKLRKDPNTKSAYLIALTGYGREPDQEQALKAGFDVHLTKPADPVTLKRLLAGIPRRKGK
jgi:two-component system CheB/CheR fusion protein